PRAPDVGRRLFLAGCKSVPEAVEQLLASVTAEHLVELDGRVQEVLSARFTALGQGCLTPQSVLQELEPALPEVAEEYAAGRLPATSVAELFFEQVGDEDAAEAEVCQFYTEAAPEITPPRASRASGGPPATELCLLTTPADEAGER